MRSLEQWMSAYGESHQNPTNQLIHKVCVPAITFSVIGLFWAIPTPSAFQGIEYLNWSTLFVIGCLFFYLSLSFKMFLGMLVKTTAFVMIAKVLSDQGIVWQVSLGIFIVAWVFQFIGHKIEGKKPSFLEDIAFLLIGPLWVLKSWYSKLGVQV